MFTKTLFICVLLQLWAAVSVSATVIPDVSLPAEPQLSLENFPIQIGKKFIRIAYWEKVTWYQAAHKCRELDGDLLNIESSSEMDQILAKLPSDDYWISSNCLAENRCFISLTTGQPMPYTRWGENEPNNAGGNEDCVQIRFRRILNDKKCDTKFHYICQARLC